jgi:hypothetical protein
MAVIAAVIEHVLMEKSRVEVWLMVWWGCHARGSFISLNWGVSNVIGNFRLILYLARFRFVHRFEKAQILRILSSSSRCKIFY